MTETRSLVQYIYGSNLVLHPANRPVSITYGQTHKMKIPSTSSSFNSLSTASLKLKYRPNVNVSTANFVLKTIPPFLKFQNGPSMSRLHTLENHLNLSSSLFWINSVLIFDARVTVD